MIGDARVFANSVYISGYAIWQFGCPSPWRWLLEVEAWD